MDGFRWLLKTKPTIRVELAWPNMNRGLEPSQLESSRAFRRWLALRSPTKDLVKFRVWSDSFETYLAARQAIEAAGFSAGWEGIEADAELELPVSFGRASQPRERLIQVD